MRRRREGDERGLLLDHPLPLGREQERHEGLRRLRVARPRGHEGGARHHQVVIVEEMHPDRVVQCAQMQRVGADDVEGHHQLPPRRRLHHPGRAAIAAHPRAAQNLRQTLGLHALDRVLGGEEIPDAGAPQVIAPDLAAQRVFVIADEAGQVAMAGGQRRPRQDPPVVQDRRRLEGEAEKLVAPLRPGGRLDRLWNVEPPREAAIHQVHLKVHGRGDGQVRRSARPRLHQRAVQIHGLKFAEPHFQAGGPRLEGGDDRLHGDPVGGGPDHQVLRRRGARGREGAEADEQQRGEPREHERRAKPAERGGSEFQPPAMPFGHGPHDGEAEPRARRLPVDGGEALRRPGAIPGRDAGARIAHRQPHVPVIARQFDPDGVPRPAMAHGVVDQVAQRLADRNRIALDRRLAAGQAVILQRQGDGAQAAFAQQFRQRVAHQVPQVQRRQPALVRPVDHHGVGQKLVGQVHRPAGLGLRPAHPVAHQLMALRIGGERELPLQRRKRRPGLMGDIGDEGFGQRAAAAQLGDETVDRVEQHRNLPRGGALDGREIAGLAGLQRLRHISQRGQRGADGQPHEEQPDQRHAAQPGHPVKEQRVALRIARAHGLADLHEDPFAPPGGGDPPPLPDEAEFLIQGRVEEQRIHRRPRPLRQRQRRRARQLSVPGGEDAVDHAVPLRQRQDVHRRLRQVHRRPRGVVGHPFQHRERGARQQQIVCAVGRGAGIVPQQDGDQQQQQREARGHPDQQPPRQRPVAPRISRRR